MITKRASLADLVPTATRSGSRPAGISRLLPIREGVEDLPIRAPRDDWQTVRMQDGDYIQRKFELGPSQLKMLVCDAIDVQEQLGHEIQIVISGGSVTIRSTTHEHGEPTERDREVARHIDAAYTEVQEAYR